MGITGHQTGADVTLGVQIQDPTTASALASVVLIAPGTSLSAKYGAVVLAPGFVQKSDGSAYDPIQGSPGITGMQSVVTEGRKNTFSFAVIDFVPAATATDMLILNGSATRVVRLTRMEIHGYATGAASNVVQLIKRTTANSAGTTGTAPTLTSHDTNNSPAVSATVVIYTGGSNPTLGTTASPASIVRAGYLNLNSVGLGKSVVWTFGDLNSQCSVLRGIAEGLALNWNGAAVPAGTKLCIFGEFTEETL